MSEASVPLRSKSKTEKLSDFAVKLLGFNITQDTINVIPSFISGFFLFSLSVLTMIQLIIKIKTNTILEENGIEVIMSTTALQVNFIKLVQVVKNRKHIFELFKLLEVNLTPLSVELQVQEEKGVYTIIKGLCIFSCGSIFFSFVQSNVISMNLDNSKPLYPITVPEDKHKYAVIFYGIVILQLVGGCSFLLVNVATVSIFAHCVNFLCCQLRLLAVNFKALASSTSGEEYFEGKEGYKKIIKLHIHLLRIVNHLQSIFDKIIFSEFLSSQFLSCILVTIAIKNIRGGLYVMAMQHVSLIPTLLLMPLIYFYLGTKLMEMSLEVSTEVYSSEWYNQPTSYNKILCIVFERMKKPMVMSAASFIPVTFNSFLKAIQAGYSYFNFLDAMYRRQT